MIDHIIIGTPDLTLGINYLMEKTGVLANYGGQHEVWNTHNALASLGDRTYLELIAPQPGKTALKPFEKINALRHPKILTWAASTDDIESLARRFDQLGLVHSGISTGVRQKPDRTYLKWKILFPELDYEGVFPFFIEWDKTSEHPADSSPGGMKLESFSIFHPTANEINKLLEAAKLPVICNLEELARLELVLKCPGGKFTFSSL